MTQKTQAALTPERVGELRGYLAAGALRPDLPAAELVLLLDAYEQNAALREENEKLRDQIHESAMDAKERDFLS